MSCTVATNDARIGASIGAVVGEVKSQGNCNKGMVAECGKNLSIV